MELVHGCLPELGDLPLSYNIDSPKVAYPKAQMFWGTVESTSLDAA